MKVPLLDLSRQHEPLRKEFEAKFSDILTTNAYCLGPEVTALEQEICDYTGAKYAIGMSSGTDALIVAMMALGIGPGDEVLCPAFTFFGTAGSIARLGATPVWVDSLPDTYNIDLGDALEKVTDKTKAIVPVHLFGQCCEMDCVKAFAKKFGIYVLEDAAQAIGAQYGGKHAGTFGDFGAYSFYPTKNLGGLGDGGMLVTNNESLADKAVWLRNHGMNPKYYHRYIGGNFRLDGIQGGLLRIKLQHLETWHNQRSKHAQFYLENFVGHSGIELPSVIEKAKSVWNQFTIRVKEGQRDALKQHLLDHGIGCEIYYPVTLDKQECFQGVGRGAETLKHAHVLADEVLSIPVFPELTEEERKYTLETIWNFGYPQK